MELNLADFSPRPAVDDALRPPAVTARAKGLTLTCKVAPEVPNALVGEAGRLCQVLTNLVGNAVKFTKKGEVAMRVELVDGPAAERGDVVRFAVSDTGIGILPAGQ
jgi:two-component system sensor histidine kinase/response regulator